VNPETIGVRAAQDSLSLLVERVAAGDAEFVITRWGVPAAVLVNVDELAAMREEAARLSAEAGKGPRA
jgi:prevent-host-death family protein